MGCASSSGAGDGSPPSHCTLSFTAGGEPAGRIVVELWEGDLPRTVANFKALCTGEKGWGYEGSRIHRIDPGFCLQGGQCGDSIYGKHFKDEGFRRRHAGYGTLYMANRGEAHTNGSQFFLALCERFELDTKHVAFGRVVEGVEVVRRLELLGTSRGHPMKEVIIAGCGVVEGWASTTGGGEGSQGGQGGSGAAAGGGGGSPGPGEQGEEGGGEEGARI